MDHQSAIQYVCDKNKLLDLAHEFGWTSAAYVQCLFPRFSLASRNPPKYRMKLKDLPESLRKEILEVIHWKTADEDLDDRDADLLIRPVTGHNLLRSFVELYSYATRILGIGEILDLRQLITEEIVCGFIDWLQEHDRCKPQSITSKLSSLHYLTCTYPKFENVDYGWFLAKLCTLRKEKHSRVQARKLNNLPDYPSIAEIAPKLLALREGKNLTEVERAWLIHDALIYMINLVLPHRSRNTCEAQTHPHKQLNIFETEISSELLSQIKLPRWAKEIRDRDSQSRFIVLHWREEDTKADHEVWELLPQEAVPLFKEYVALYRPLLLRKHNPNSTSLFFTRTRKKLNQKSLLSLVSRISMRFTGKRMTVKLFRDLVAARMLASGATVDEVADRLWHLDLHSTTVRFYLGGFNASDGVVALEDEFAAQAA
jgi:hypothetical protein